MILEAWETEENPTTWGLWKTHDTWTNSDTWKFRFTPDILGLKNNKHAITIHLRSDTT